MDKILDLSISYPDFQLNQIIDPEQVDLNNAQIVDKANRVINFVNTLTGNKIGENGAVHITANTISELGDASNVQSMLERIVSILKSSSGATFINAISNENAITNVQEYLNILNDTAKGISIRLEDVERRATNHETVDGQYGVRIASLETSDISQDSKILSLEINQSSILTHNVTQDNRLYEIESKNTFQTQQISDIQSKNSNQDSRLTTVENTTKTHGSNIDTIKSDIARINQTNTNQEVIDARGLKTTLKQRIDYNEINIGANKNPNSKLNMIVTDSNSTEFWEDKVATGSLIEHNADPKAHGGTITAHETDKHSHSDIRNAISNIKVDWDSIPNKPTMFPSQVHNHTKSQISDFAHTHLKSNITDFVHTHSKGDISDFAHTHSKNDVALSNVDNVKQMPIGGGVFTGNVSMNANSRLSGHIVIPIGKPSNVINGSIWIS